MTLIKVEVRAWFQTKWVGLKAGPGRFMTGTREAGRRKRGNMFLNKLTEPVPELIDPFGRAVTYLRVSVTDRCDFRCVYCMSEHMTFLPRRELLTLEELERLC
ncbi:MAG: hypothetical protein ACTSU0_05435, partial [Alphaproteobacteria bacterium]